MNDDRMKDVVLTFLERRIYLKRNESLSHADRISRIKDETKRHIQMKEATLELLLKRFNEGSNVAAAEEYLTGLKTEIQIVDSDIVLMKRGIVAVAFAVVHYYYKLGWNSSQIAEELGIKPPCVRVWLYRLCHQAAGTQDQSKNRKGAYNSLGVKWPAHLLQSLFVLRAQGKNLSECSRLMHISRTTLVAAWKNCFGKLTVGKAKVKVKSRLLDLGFLCELRTDYRMSNPQCAEFLGFSLYLIRYHCERMGLNASSKVAT